jgi:hypothetical protein
LPELTRSIQPVYDKGEVLGPAFPAKIDLIQGQLSDLKVIQSRAAFLAQWRISALTKIDLYVY